jgi:hypothetical protein
MLNKEVKNFKGKNLSVQFLHQERNFLLFSERFEEKVV